MHNLKKYIFKISIVVNSSFYKKVSELQLKN